MSDIRPEYKITLSDDELIELGRFSALWSQMDMLICLVLSMLTGCDLKATLAFLGATTTGPKLNLLRQQETETDDPEITNLIKSICKEIGRVVDDRNHIVHGIWGMHTDDKGKSRAGSYFPRKGVDAPLYADQLTDLCERVADITRDLGKLLSQVNKDFPQQNDPKVFWFSSHPPAGTKKEEWFLATPKKRA
jgi:hypothetical protein